ncbi:MAG TPA: rhodanese-like domain-containing protein [Methylomirabilota bacterium]|jgi:ArsR family transcriptional regulator|nr:rhodanese-like domain-containing protein [Methylomirabilota bacterium]
MRRLLRAALVAGILGWVTAVPADDPEVPEKYAKVDEVKALIDQNKPVTLVDVRPKPQYDIIHIRGAVSIPLQELPKRIAEVPKKDLVVLY